jgi:hypothetical protein
MQLRGDCCGYEIGVVRVRDKLTEKIQFVLWRYKNPPIAVRNLTVDSISFLLHLSENKMSADSSISLISMLLTCPMEGKR